MIHGQPIRVLVIESSDIMKQGLKGILKNADGIQVIDEVPDVESVFTLCKSDNIDVILMDVDFLDSAGLSTIQALCECHPQLPIIVLIHPECYQLTDTIIQSGVLGCLTKNVTSQELIRAIRMVAFGKPVVIRYSARRSHSLQLRVALTQREKEVLSLLVRGLTNRQIAEELEVSRYTIKNHISKLFIKLDVTSRTEATMLTLKHNIIQIDYNM